MTDGNDANLSALEHRLDELEDGLRLEYPTAETPGGGAQRLRLEVPTPWSLMTIGARGTGASDGRAVGPGGFALMTVESFGAEIQGNTCIDTDGLTIVHSIGAARVLTQENLGVASSAAMRLGTTEGHIELTAGEVPVHDPAFKVIPSMAVPAAPDVDTATPRGPTESAKSAAGAIWDGLEVAGGINTWLGFVLDGMPLSSGVAAGTLLARVAGVINLFRTGVAMINAGVAAAAAVSDVSSMDRERSSAPAVKLHGAGGVKLTSPEGISAFGNELSLTARQTASLKASAKVSIKSAGYASFYGGLVTSISSEGPATLKSTLNAATVSGKYADVSGKDTAVVRSKKLVGVIAGQKFALESPTVVMGGGEYVGVSSGDMVQLEAPFVHSAARRQNTVSSTQKVVVKGDREVQLESGSAKMTVKDGEFRIDPGAGKTLIVDRQSLRFLTFRVEGSRTRIRGPVDIG